MESPRSKQAYKDFYKHFKAKEKDSIPAAKAFALDALKSVPENAAWRVHLELADLAKRSNLIQEVCRLLLRMESDLLDIIVSDSHRLPSFTERRVGLSREPAWDGWNGPRWKRKTASFEKLSIYSSSV